MTQRSKRRLYAEFVLLALLAGVFMGQSPSVVARLTGAYEFFDPIVDIRNELVRYYVDEPDQEEMMVGAIDGMIEALDDPYTNYFTEEQLKSFNKQTRGTFSGIGAEIDQKDDYIVIVSPLEDSPAFKAGLSAGDLILAVNGESLEGATSEEAVEKITGPEGTEVTLTMRFAATGEEKDVVITRKRIKIQTIKGFSRDDQGHWDYMLDDEHKVGYIRMTQFSQVTYDNLVKALDELDDQNMEGLILDLRYNPGGLLDAAVKISDLFLEEGVIVSTRGRVTPEHKWEAKPAGTLDDFPIVVLINGGSASASEILAGALKYNGRAKVLGTRTVGKGSVQQIIPLDGGHGGIKLTTSHYYLPNGSNIHKKEGASEWGVDPSDGFYVLMSNDEMIEMLKVRRESEIIKPKDEHEDNGNAAVTPEWINEQLKDKQLAAALETIVTRLDDGKWAEVGPGSATVMTQLARKEQLERGKKLLLERIDEVDEELEKIDKILREEEVEEDEPTEDETVAIDDGEAEAEVIVEETEPELEPVEAVE